jgi:aspartyl-tRNA(Asn)/glutamyl-tRNA(Gln) amidotransferase subunit A
MADNQPLLTLHEIAGQLAAGEITSEMIVESLLNRIDSVDPVIGAYVHVNRDSAMDAARHADSVRRSGSAAANGKLLGIPIGIKDLIHVRGEPCTCASRILRNFVSPYDATVIERLRQEGAIFLGRLNLDEFAMGSTTENSSIKLTRNPWETTHVPGGSSGGSAAAVSSDLAIATLGTDTGGSIRQPAAFCGCVGLKPTYGRVSRYGLTAFASTLDQIGPLTRDVRDAAILLGIMAGHDSKDSTSVDLPVPDFEASLGQDLRGLKIGVPREYMVDGLDDDVRTGVETAIDACRSLGAEIVDISLPHTEYAIATYYIIAAAEASANLARYDGIRYGTRAPGARDPLELYLRSRAEGFGTEVKRRILLGTYVLSSGYHDKYYLSAQKVRTLIRRDFEAAFQVCDVLVGPVAPTAAYRLGETVTDPMKMYLGDIFTVTANLAGICGMSVPTGLNRVGLPLAVQMLGGFFEEAKLLRVASAFEMARGPMPRPGGIA